MKEGIEKKISDRSLSVSISGIRKIAQFAKGVEDIIPMNLGEPDFSTPDYIRKAAKKAIDEGFTHYTTPLGIPELREAIAERTEQERGFEVNPKSEVLVTAGTSAAFYSIVHALLNPGDEIIVPDPCYPSYMIGIQLTGGKAVPVPLEEEKEFNIDPQAVEEKITARTKAILIVSPDNPTGAVMNKDTLEAIAEIARRHDVITISDELYEKIVYDGAKSYSIAALPEMKERTVTINGFSKTYAMTGWRIGYIIANKVIIDNARKIHHPFTVCATSISQKAALAALEGPQDFFQDMLKKYDERRKYLIKGLNDITGVKCQMPKGAFYAFPNVKSFKQPSMEIVKYIIKEGRVLTVPGSAFGKNSEGYIRLSYATSLEKIKEALPRIREALNKLMNKS
ncbi:MAG: aminotransferase class I/II-fold pyridoxal phosphate-dependent enzyme [Nitrososphaeria archaeon]|nr:aminotransferase class I/II-fold pyridoxal phosphate-dependent enzyme [Nitrososphaeria archaeon]NIN53120.1 aminotransferase class I/II-fold pyridoxal phosphate-dependent enzyme [Nitrososphaeria archaeon]NIQ33886.1 aminotransferase class I/II-fold pyridoxal phosphate-dependent enzyme [Nitrososphaeria archaeon]